MSTIKISELTSSGAILGNVLVPIVGNIAGTLTTIKSTVDQLKTFIVASAEANILAANAATVFANTIMKSYVDLANTIQSAQLTSANIGIIGYVDLANTIQSAQIASANLGIVGYVDNAVSTANIGIKGYVDSVASQSIYGNGNVTSYTVTMGFTNYSNVNTKAYAESMGYQNYGNVNVAAYVTTANSAVVGYVDNAVSTANIGMNGLVNAVIDAVNVANIVVTQSIVSANVGLKGYVDSLVGGGSSYGNANVTAYTVSMGFTNYSNVNVAALITTNGLTNYSNVNAKAYAETMGYQNFGNVNVAAYVTTANSAVVGYVDNAVSTANVGIIGYIDRGNTIVTAGITTANVGLKGYVDAGIIWSISASGTADYVFSGPGIVAGNTNDPVLYLYKGFSYTFINTTGGSHPFAIRISNGGADYTSGVSGSQTGTQIFTVPMDAPSTLYYQCTIHGGMGNTINIV
jgi:hypothetical protein